MGDVGRVAQVAAILRERFYLPSMRDDPLTERQVNAVAREVLSALSSPVEREPSEAEVEAAAKAMSGDWEGLSERERNAFRHDARAALLAALSTPRKDSDE